ncbi:hypothetical protein M440DRAFT_1164792 [Trichoderma longibrachiatum ATCC 18648]|uniref:Uncharacterized protein n=1 Tax=Trichoderma longibrachiatum ATCC 18648 TaxID=983965 RepID=A0A2T4CCJ7_TRILO|nr:hypothetical protein M440DRAFT_1164792 [Trichoderma longibrachiatum ATCC 18648]
MVVSHLHQRTLPISRSPSKLAWLLGINISRQLGFKATNGHQRPPLLRASSCDLDVPMSVHRCSHGWAGCWAERSGCAVLRRHVFGSRNLCATNNLLAWCHISVVRKHHLRRETEANAVLGRFCGCALLRTSTSRIRQNKGIIRARLLAESMRNTVSRCGPSDSDSSTATSTML